MIVVSGSSSIVLQGDDPKTVDPTPYLRIRKNRKFMGTQDDLAVVAMGRSLEHAGLVGVPLGERAGLYAVVGFIPFDQSDIAPVLEGSLVDGEFSMERFSTDGFRRAHPLLTFRCLPNMPAYHVSANFDLQGPYLVTYPGAGQTYAALEEACSALEAGTIDFAFVLTVAHQRNFLVEHHFSRLEPPAPARALCDVACCLVLEREEAAAQRGGSARIRLLRLEHEYQPFDVLGAQSHESETLHDGAEALAAAFSGRGPAGLSCALDATLRSAAPSRRLEHRLSTRDGVVAFSAWQTTDTSLGANTSPEGSAA
jgi:3-oxoacyl-[acyl-carrier-protein] synthase II